MNGKRGIGEIGALVLVVFLGIVILTAGTMFYGSLFNRYGVTDYSDANSSNITAAYSQINASVETIAANIYSSESAGEASYIMLFQGGFEALKQIPNVLLGLANLVGGVGDFFMAETGLNVLWFVGFLLAALAVWVGFRFLEVVIGREV